jgi:acetyltransferase-like isoleucine patch superfamily enzyme
MSFLLNPWRGVIQIRFLIENILAVFPIFKFLTKTRNKEYPITLKIWFDQKVIGTNKYAYWPMHPSSQVSFSQKVLIGKNVFPGYQYGCFIHGQNGIVIGDYTFIAPNVGIMSGNHDLYDLRNQTINQPIIIGKYCWLGMNSMILPEVELGDFTIVGAGSVVTKSFNEGYCVLVGNPARVIKKLDPEKCIKYEQETTHIGYIAIEKFEEFKQMKLDI